MNINIPKTEQQKHFEEFAGVFLAILARLTEEERTQVFKLHGFLSTTKKNDNRRSYR